MTRSMSLALPAPRQPALVGLQPAIIGFWAILAATLFNVVLCFLNTQHLMSVTSTQIIAIESAILLAGLLAARNLMGRAAVQFSGVVIVCLLALKLLNGDLDLKIIHDLSIMLVFFLLGCVCPAHLASRLVTIALVIVAAVGLVEWLLPTVFESMFDIWGYYLDKGALDATTVNYSNTKLFISGQRSVDAGRTLLPAIFGVHRISSVFLEPVSLGNFAIICLAWLLSMPPRSATMRLVMALAVALCVVFPDSRFAAASCVMMVLFRMTPLHRSSVVAFFLPVVAIAGLLLYGSQGHDIGIEPQILNDDFSGRLLFSGQLLGSWTWRQWLGLAGSPVYTADTGYAYAILNLGLPLALLIWFAFAVAPIASRQGQTMRGMVALYVTASLCVGASAFSIKTAALCWFLYGVTTQLQRLAGDAASRERVVRGAAFS